MSSPGAAASGRTIRRLGVIATGVAGLILAAVVAADGLPMLPPLGLPRQVPRAGEPDFAAHPGPAFQAELDGLNATGQLSQTAVEQAHAAIAARFDDLAPLPPVVVDGITIASEVLEHDAFGLWEAQSVTDSARHLGGDIEPAEIGDDLIDRTIAVAVTNLLLYEAAADRELVSDEEVVVYARLQRADFETAAANGTLPAGMAGMRAEDFESGEQLALYRELLSVDKMRSVLLDAADDPETNDYLAEWLTDRLAEHLVTIHPALGIQEDDIPGLVAACPVAVC